MRYKRGDVVIVTQRSVNEGFTSTIMGIHDYTKSDGSVSILYSLDDHPPGFVNIYGETELVLDKQYYREKRLKKILDE